MTDDSKPPRLPWRITRDITAADDEVYVPPAPDTERLPLIPPAPKAPKEPFKLLPGRAPSYVEFAAIVKHVNESLDDNRQRLTDVLSTQRKMALQQDGLIQTVNRRFDIFHEELSMLRQVVSVDHGPRITAAEKGVAEAKASVGDKVRHGSIVAGKYGGLVLALALGARAIGKQFPEYYDVIDGVLGAVGL